MKITQKYNGKSANQILDTAKVSPSIGGKPVIMDEDGNVLNSNAGITLRIENEDGKLLSLLDIGRSASTKWWHLCADRALARSSALTNGATRMMDDNRIVGAL